MKRGARVATKLAIFFYLFFSCLVCANAASLVEPENIPYIYNGVAYGNVIAEFSANGYTNHLYCDGPVLTYAYNNNTSISWECGVENQPMHWLIRTYDPDGNKVYDNNGQQSLGKVTAGGLTLSGFTNDTVRTSTDIVDQNDYSLIVFAKNFGFFPTLTFNLSDTGQTKCYDNGQEIPCPSPGRPFYGQDGNYSGPQPSFRDNGYGTITDNHTGLVWQKTENPITNWYKAAGVYDPGFNANSENVCGGLGTGWRLPTRRELMSIIDYSILSPGPTINTTFFPNTQSYYYWSSGTYLANPLSAWIGNFSDGAIDYFYKGNAGYVRCVRGKQSPEQSLVDNGNGTVSDTVTGLMWQQGEAGYMPWDLALAYCEDLALGDYSDWRLPNLKEMESLSVNTRINPAINLTHFPNADGSYWTSTTYTSLPVRAWLWQLYDGFIFRGDKEGLSHVRCVRGGNVEPQACAYTYSDWGSCQPDGTQTRTVLTATPNGCPGTPTLSQSCIYAPPKIEVFPSKYDFGTWNVGLCSGTPQQFILSNIGGADILVSNISLSDTTNFKLLLDGGLNPCDASNPIINPGNSCSITVDFCPSTAGSFNLNLEVSSNDPSKKLLDIPVTGSGVIQTKSTAPGRVVIIDGIQILSILNPSYPNNYSHYLMDAITSNKNWIKKIQQRVGVLTPFVWSRTDIQEDDYILVLSSLLEKYSNENKKTGGKLVVLAHSWGTVLAYVAINLNSNIQVDKFISLGSPLNAQSDFVRSHTVSDLSEWNINQVQHPSNIVTWDNFWASCDPISGNIPPADHNYKIKTNYIDPETSPIIITCHAAYYEDYRVLKKIMPDTIILPKH